MEDLRRTKVIDGIMNAVYIDEVKTDKFLRLIGRLMGE